MVGCPARKPTTRTIYPAGRPGGEACGSQGLWLAGSLVLMKQQVLTKRVRSQPFPNMTNYSKNLILWAQGAHTSSRPGYAVSSHPTSWSLRGQHA